MQIASLILASLAALHVVEAPRDEALEPGNVLFVLMDDISAYEFSQYQPAPALAKTPTLDALIEDGVLFRNAWTLPICSPTRAAIFTGRHGFRTGIGKNIAKQSDFGIQEAELTLPELLDGWGPERLSTGAFGKWHMHTNQTGGAFQPNLWGFDRYEGSPGNLMNGFSYFSYHSVVDGTLFPGQTTYATTAEVDAASAWISATEGPWFCYLAFHAAHEVWQEPPPELYTTPIATLGSQFTERPEYRAMIEAMDTELGRLLDSMDPDVRARTTIVVMADNGTPKQVVPLDKDPDHAKGTLYEGGVHVPLFVSGPVVAEPGREVDALVHAVDLYATLAQLCGVDVELGPGATRAPVLDSVSLVPYLTDPAQEPLREFVYTENFAPNGFGPFTKEHRAIRDARWKLIRFDDDEELFDLDADPDEEKDLLLFPLDPEAADAYSRLSAEMDALLAS